MKKCPNCEQVKTATSFGHSKRSKDKRQHYCKQCRSNKYQAWYKAITPKQKQYENERQRKWWNNLTPKQRKRKNKQKRARYALMPPEKHEEYLIQQRTYRKELKIDIIDKYGGSCTCCSERRKEFLVVDHIHGDGNKHRKEIHVKSGTTFYRWLKKNNYPDGFQILCHNCNMSYGIYGYCPHNKQTEYPEGEEVN